MSAGSFTGNLHVLEKGRRDSIFVPGIGRFAQADTIVGSIANPQYLNRYSYVLNRPGIFVDSSGHLPGCVDEFGCRNVPTSYPPPPPPPPPPGMKDAVDGSTSGRRLEIPQLELDLIAVTVYAETNGEYPDDMIELIIWASFNAYMDPNYDHLTMAIGNLVENLKEDGYEFFGSNRRQLALQILDLYKNTINNVDFNRVLDMVMDIYQNKWLTGAPDPTNGARVFSMATSLARVDINKVVVNQWKDHEELRGWLVTNFETHSTWYPDFTYVITDVFVWDQDDSNALGILVLGNGPMSVGCVPYSNCGLPGWRP